MVIILFSDKKYEFVAEACIKTIENKLRPNDKIIYFSIGFDSDIEAKNLYKIYYEDRHLPFYDLYKGELSLRALKMFPREKYFIYTDIDILFSKRFKLEYYENNLHYPLASYGPFEFPLGFDLSLDGQYTWYNEENLMKYFNIASRSMRYVQACFYTFNHNCEDFLEEYRSICNNTYLSNPKRIKQYFTFRDETPFNICLWKRNATENLGFAFVNTDLLDSIIKIEETNLRNETFKNGPLDPFGNSWEYIDDSSKVMMYHGFKTKEKIEPALQYLLS